MNTPERPSRSFSHRLVVVAALCCCWLIVGCSNESVPPDPATHFNQTQGHTVTPHGRVVPNSATDESGYIHYETEDGSKWRVRYNADEGDYRYGNAESIP